LLIRIVSVSRLFCIELLALKVGSPFTPCTLNPRIQKDAILIRINNRRGGGTVGDHDTLGEGHDAIGGCLSLPCSSRGGVP